MHRIVYSPKAYVYILTDEGIYNVSDYVVSGSVSRKVNQISSAEVTLQNPYRKFTQPGAPTFRPMDRITVFLQRLPGLPCQVFTGYLDETPYYQMYPGTCTLRASCTLKKLQYTWFDPGVPFMIQFMGKYGWKFDESGSVFATPFSDPNTTRDEKQSQTMSDLLFAVLKHIAGIDPGQILIEELPHNLIERISKIYHVLQNEQKEVDEKFQEWIKEFIGEVSLGTGGAADAPTGDNASGIPYAGTITKWARHYNFEPALIAAIIERESNFQVSAVGHDPGGTVGEGLMQLTSPGYKAWWAEYIDAGESSLSANIHAGCRALREKVIATGDLWQGVKAYNGSGAAAEEYMNDVKNNRYPKYKRLFEAAGGGTPPEEVGEDDPTNSDTTDDAGPTHSDSDTTRYDAIVAEANKLSRLATSGKMPYGPQRPPTSENDCSSSCTLLLKAAGYKIDGWPATSTIKQYMKKGRDPTGRVTFWNSDKNNVAGNSVHIWAEIDGRPFTTADHLGGHWKDDYYAKDNPPARGFEAYHVTKLDEPHDVPADADTDSGGDGGESTLGWDDALSAAKAGSIFTTLQFPSAVNMTESTLLTGERSLMNDQPLLPFIEQLCKGTLRSFQSLPNGDFYAWHPDYFGALGTSPYWEISDIEVLSGNIQLSDNQLVTHSYVVGATNADQSITIDRRIQTRGVVTIMNAGNADFLNLNPTDVKEKVEKKKKLEKKKTKDKEKREDAVDEPFLGDYESNLKFLNRYGARPVVEDAPFIRSHAFETFYAFQNFMLAWSRQFLTTFTFTFMPELYPGGIVKFADHGIAMYIDEVQHSWDYTSGFTTQANLSAPASIGTHADKAGISRGMVTQIK